MLKNIIFILNLKKIPNLYWSSQHEYNLRPKRITIFYLVFGLILFGIGEALLITANIGVSPWFVLHQGLAFQTGYSIGITTFIVSIIVLLIWFPLKQKPGIGTILNALIIGLMIDVCIRYVPTPENFISQILLGAFAVLTVGIGGGIYLVANLGAGPRDGLMVGLQKKTNLPIALVRATIEITVVSIGWYLGGTVGIGTLLFAFGIGPCVALGLYLVDKIFND